MREQKPSGNQARYRKEELTLLTKFWSKVDAGVESKLTFLESIEEATLYFSDNGHISDGCREGCPACEAIWLN